MKLDNIFKQLDIKPEDKQDSEVSLWKQWYQGRVKDFHTYTDYMGKAGSVTRDRYSLGMGKVVAELWADNIWNPETEIVMGEESNQEWLDDKLEKLNFTNNFNTLVEQYMALGTGATVEYLDDKGITRVDFLTVESIFPYEFDNDDVMSCAFVSQYDKDIVYLQDHKLNYDDTYTITNKFYEKKDDDYIEITYEGIQEEITSPIKMFQIYKPAIANNININNPMGLSIFANAIKELEAVDTSFDAFRKEIKNGRMRVYLKESALSVDIEGKEVRYVNKDQDEFYVLPSDDTFEDETFIKVEAPQLRVQSFIDGLNESLNLLGRKCGLGDNQFSSKDGTIYTNTSQVVSTNSKFYKTRRKHASLVEYGLVGMIEALYYLENGRELEDTVAIQFDDSIIHDKEEEFQRSLLLFNQGIISKVTFVEQAMGMTTEEAQDFVARQQLDEGIVEVPDFEGVE